MANAENEKVKRRYFNWLRGAKGYAEQTIVAIERAIYLYEESTDFQSFKTFSEKKATGFKTFLANRRNKGKTLSNTSKYSILRHVNAFFSWLATQSGFRSKITLDAVSYLVLDRNSVRDALSVRPIKFPSLNQVKRLVESIPDGSELDKRDRALISFLLLTGIRYRAVCSLTLGCIDIGELIVYQDPRRGVKTKGGKLIVTRILPFDQELVAIVQEWVGYLSEQAGFGPSDPLFPKTLVRQADDGYTFEAVGLSKDFWQGGNSIREIIKDRSMAAGLTYFNPHSFRHAAFQLGIGSSSTPEQLKALSQNFGHEQVTTTLRSYGNLDDARVSQVLSEMDFSGTKKVGQGEFTIEDLKAFVKSRKK